MSIVVIEINNESINGFTEVSDLPNTGMVPNNIDDSNAEKYPLLNDLNIKNFFNT